jgi:hypothetical protein
MKAAQRKINKRDADVWPPSIRTGTHTLLE